jgi:hypothetical protein
MDAHDPKRVARIRGAKGRPEFGVGPVARASTALEIPLAFDSRQRVAPTVGAATFGFGLPNLRRNVCPHFYMT